MKTLISLFLVFVLFISMNKISAQVDKKAAKSTANKLFSLCQKNNYSSASSILAYHGSNESRLYKDTYNYSNSSEASDVKRFCKRVKAMIEISDSYDFGSFRKRKMHGKEVQSLDVIFKSGNQKIKNKLTFIEINGKPAIYKLD
ncbi:MAG: hypothetical protein ABFS12_04140 [Bacteroidota bacterium]